MAWFSDAFHEENPTTPEGQVNIHVKEEFEKHRFDQLIESNRAVNQYSQEKTIAGIVLRNLQSFSELTSRAELRSDHPQALPFGHAGQELDTILMNFSNSTYVFRLHSITSIGRKFGRKSEESIQLKIAFSKLEPYLSLLEAVRHYAIHIALPEISLNIRDVQEGRTMTAELHVAPLIKARSRDRDQKANLATFGGKVNLQTAFSEWASRFEEVLGEVYQLHAKHALGTTTQVRELIRQQNSDGAPPVLVEYEQQGDAIKFKTHHIDVNSIYEIEQLAAIGSESQ